MRLPKTSRTSSELKELRLGRGDYAAGGSRSLPFLDLDNARRRRPLVFGEITDDLSGYPELAAGMFSGRETDPAEWAVMWKEIGADGICIRINDADRAVELVRTVSDRTRLPIIVDVRRDMVCSIAESIDDTILMFFSDEVLSDGHLAAVICDDADEATRTCGEQDSVISFKPSCKGLRDLVDRIEEYRARGLSGDTRCSNPILVDVSYVWDSEQYDDVRSASMHEATAALSVMMAGADMIIVRGPGAADMARVYGEELADL